MKKLKKILCLALLSLAVTIGNLAAPQRVCGVAKAAEPSSSEAIADSLFFVDPSLVRTNNNLIYVYDAADQTIKVIDRQTKDFASGNNHLRLVADEILFFENLMIVYSDALKTFKYVALNDFSQVKNLDTQAIDLENVKSMHIVSVGDASYLLLCPNQPTSQAFQVAKLHLAEGTLSVESVREFTISTEFVATAGTFSISYATELDGKLFIMLVIEAGIVSLQIDPETVSGRCDINAVSMEDKADYDGTSIRNIATISLADSTKHLAITTDNFIRLYDLDNSGSFSLKPFEGRNRTINSQEPFDDVCGGGSIVCLVSVENQELLVYSFDDGSVDPVQIQNAEIVVRYYSHEDFEYNLVNQDTLLRPSPYSKDADKIIEAHEGDNVVIIGEGCYSTDDERDGKRIYGYDYCLLTRDGVNYYGYISDIDIIALPPTTYSAKLVSVLPFTRVMRYPSVAEDENNTILREITSSSSVRLEVLDSICDYATLSSGEARKFLKVRINGDDNLVGFIDRSSVLPVIDKSERVLPNATVLRDKSQIFTEKDDQSEVIVELDKGARVKVIGKRDTVTNLTHVRFNYDGVELEGYIYTYNLEADSWNMVQMIGILLVVINVILLIIIICIKNRVTK